MSIETTEKAIIRDLFQYILPSVYKTSAVIFCCMERFSCLQDVLYATKLSFDFLPDTVAIQVVERLSVVREFCIRAAYVTKGTCYDNTTKAAFIRMAMARVNCTEREKIYAFFFTLKNHYIAMDNVAIGSNAIAVFDASTIIEKIQFYKAKKVILIHNHPTGDVIASAEDIYTTKIIQKHFMQYDYILIDHWVTTLRQVYSIKHETVLYSV